MRKTHLQYKCMLYCIHRFDGLILHCHNMLTSILPSLSNGVNTLQFLHRLQCGEEFIIWVLFALT